ncbi:hypothetical protein Pmani_023562 [Petrolisthes manimaculis]|uniref:Uncharacterized protein n=1 Tax=Petrolisthes manimaculis TaxID=1843537 RepID=A0AAE1U052_9EUCA|nr:hypothetical protein Pmani_023562 [Petrolisthes manimaculis]
MGKSKFLERVLRGRYTISTVRPTIDQTVPSLRHTDDNERWLNKFARLYIGQSPSLPTPSFNSDVTEGLESRKRDRNLQPTNQLCSSGNIGDLGTWNIRVVGLDINERGT